MCECIYAMCGYGCACNAHVCCDLHYVRVDMVDAVFLHICRTCIATCMCACTMNVACLHVCVCMHLWVCVYTCVPWVDLFTCVYVHIYESYVYVWEHKSFVYMDAHVGLCVLVYAHVGMGCGHACAHTCAFYCLHGVLLIYSYFYTCVNIHVLVYACVSML